MLEVDLLSVPLPFDASRGLGDVGEAVEVLKTGDGALSLNTLFEEIEGEIARF